MGAGRVRKAKIDLSFEHMGCDMTIRQSSSHQIGNETTRPEYRESLRLELKTGTS